MAIALPDDILYMICSQIWEMRDFSTLFNCAITGKRLAVPALSHIYRMQDIVPVINGGGDEDQVTVSRASYPTKEKRQEQIVKKWAGLWRTLILASLGKTLYTYSRYLRTLNLQDLGELFQEPRFRTKISSSFFADELGDLKFERQAPSGKNSSLVLDIDSTIKIISEALITETPNLEELRANVTAGALGRWIPGLPRLKHIHLWDGDALRNTGRLIGGHCHSFAKLQFWSWTNPDADQVMGSFLNEINQHSLQSLEIVSHSTIGPESFLALNCHKDSLTQLHLRSISADAMTSLHFLKGCTNIVSLQLSESPASTTDLEYRHNDIFLETIAWLRECKHLKSIKLSHFFSGPSLLTPILLEDDIELAELELHGYTMTVGKTFHRALSQQRSLRSLYLKGEGDDMGTDGYDILVDSLSKLENLTELSLENISDYFQDKHICRLARRLPKLENFATSGWGITDAVLKELVKLKYLKRLLFNALTNFTAKGLLAYVQGLGYSNQGFVLAVMMADMDSTLELREQDLIRETLSKRVGGTFDFMYIRDPEVSEFENSDSD